MIFSDTQKKANEKLDDIAGSLEEEILVRKQDYIKTPTKIIQAKRFSEGCRGYRYLEVYVDYSLSDSETMSLIRAKLLPPSAYDLDKWDEPYNYKDYIHYF